MDWTANVNFVNLHRRFGVFIVDFNDFVFCRTYHVNRGK